MDWDSVLSYSTGRFARIRNWRLGALHYCFEILIFCYVVVYQILVKKGYRKIESPVSSIRLQARAPSGVYLPKSLHSLPYCSDTAFAKQGLMNTSCAYLNEGDVIYPYVEESAILLSTRISKLRFRRPQGCKGDDQFNPNCMLEEKAFENQTLITVAPVWFTLLFDHNVASPNLGIAGTVDTMSGVLLGVDGEIIDPCDDYTSANLPCPTAGKDHSQFTASFGTQGLRDIVPVASLLRAANLSSIDSIFDPKTKGLETMRATGLVLVVTIEYSNQGSYNPYKVGYIARVSLVEKAEFKVQEIVRDGDRTDERFVLDRHGVRLMVKQTGELGMFDMTTLLIQLVTSLALLSLSTTITDYVMIYVMKHRDEFSELKFATSRDFHQRERKRSISSVIHTTGGVEDDNTPLLHDQHQHENQYEHQQQQHRKNLVEPHPHPHQQYFGNLSGLAGKDMTVKWRVAQNGRQDFVAVCSEDGNEIPLLNLDATGTLTKEQIRRRHLF